jgi:hypothetical protein
MPSQNLSADSEAPRLSLTREAAGRPAASHGGADSDSETGVTTLLEPQGLSRKQRRPGYSVTSLRLRTYKLARKSSWSSGTGSAGASPGQALVRRDMELDAATRPNSRKFSSNLGCWIHSVHLDSHLARLKPSLDKSAPETQTLSRWDLSSTTSLSTGWL